MKRITLADVIIFSQNWTFFAAFIDNVLTLVKKLQDTLVVSKRTNMAIIINLDQKFYILQCLMSGF